MRGYHAFWIPLLILCYWLLFWSLVAQADYVRSLEQQVRDLQPTPLPVRPLCNMGYGIPCPPDRSSSQFR